MSDHAGGLRSERMSPITSEPFLVRDCALITLSTGLRARNLRELAERIEQCPRASIEYHFFSSQLRPTFDDPEYQNDFAIWARRALQDQVLAERLGALDPLHYDGIEALRSILLDVVEERLSEIDYIRWAPHTHEFIFQYGRIVVFSTGLKATTVAELSELLPNLTASSIFYHFVEARRRKPVGQDDLTAWLKQTGEDLDDLCHQLSALDYYFAPLTELRSKVSDAVRSWVEHREGVGA